MKNINKVIQAINYDTGCGFCTEYCTCDEDAENYEYDCLMRFQPTCNNTCEHSNGSECGYCIDCQELVI